MRRLSVLPLVLCLAFPLLATEPNPSQRQTELIEKLLTLMKISGNTAAMMDAVNAQIEQQYLGQAAANGNSEEAMAEAKELFAAFRAESAKIDFAGLLHDSFVRIYAKYYNEQELADLIAFYSTPTGQKTIDVMDDLMREGMQAGIEHVAPKIEETMKRVGAEHEKKRPWRRTMNDLLSLAAAIEAYQTDNGQYPAGDYAALQEELGDYIESFPEKDIWGHAYAYVVSNDRLHYRLVSAGADSIFDWDSRRIPAAGEGELRYRDRLEDDVIYGDGEWRQLPAQSKQQ